MNRGLYALLRACMPPSRRHWLDALENEAGHLQGEKEREHWLRGAGPMLVAAWRDELGSNPSQLPVALLLAVASAMLTLESNHLPFLAAVSGSVAFLSFLAPGSTWRWIVLAMLVVPLAASFDLTPRYDMPYPMFPGLVEGLLAMSIRRVWNRGHQRVAR